MSQEYQPEIIRSPLQNVILKAKLLEMGSPVEILALALDPPNLNDIHNSISLLKEVGGLLQLNILSEIVGVLWSINFSGNSKSFKLSKYSTSFLNRHGTSIVITEISIRRSKFGIEVKYIRNFAALAVAELRIIFTLDELVVSNLRMTIYKRETLIHN